MALIADGAGIVAGHARTACPPSRVLKRPGLGRCDHLWVQPPVKKLAAFLKFSPFGRDDREAGQAVKILFHPPAREWPAPPAPASRIPPSAGSARPAACSERRPGLRRRGHERSPARVTKSPGAPGLAPNYARTLALAEPIADYSCMNERLWNLAYHTERCWSGSWSFSRVAAARRIPAFMPARALAAGFLARARHARGNDTPHCAAPMSW